MSGQFLPKPCDSLEYAKGCRCGKCMAHQDARDRQYREERIREREHGWPTTASRAGCASDAPGAQSAENADVRGGEA